MLKPKIGLLSATALVISSMVGTGVYTSLGFQVEGVPFVFGLLVLWLAGGIVALCGSLVYGEIGSVIKGSGGEYNYLSQIYHPVFGFISGFVSSVAGFAAPVALSAMAFGRYLSIFFPSISPEWPASILVISVTLVQLAGIKKGALVQRYCTLVNISLIIIFIIAGLVTGPYPGFDATLGTGNTELFFSSPFAVSLVFVSYSYSGWNSSAYVSGEIRDPVRNLPLSLSGGTLLVTMLYLALNFVFLYNVPLTEFEGKIEAGHLAASSIFGTQGAYLVSGLISLGLVASVNAMSMIGARVTKAIAEDYGALAFLTRENSSGNPYLAQCMLAFISLFMIHTAAFEDVLTYIGFTLTLFTAMTVGGIFILRKRYPEHAGFKAWGYPFTPLIFLLINSWMMIYILKENIFQSVAGLLTALAGAFIYMLIAKTRIRNQHNQ